MSRTAYAPVGTRNAVARLWGSNLELWKWNDRAACGDEADQAPWFPAPDTTRDKLPPAVQRTLTICARCPVRRPCLEYALETRSEGTWGGTLEWEREKFLEKKGGRISELMETSDKRVRAFGLDLIAERKVG